jgi:hypothetical protein
MGAVLIKCAGEFSISRGTLSAPIFPAPPVEQILWLKADAGVTTSGSTVTAWADQSGKGNDAVPTSTPYFIANQLNSKPVIYFDGTGPRFVAPLSLPSTTARSIFVVGKYTDTSGPQQGFLNLAYDSEADKGYLFKSDSNDDSYWYASGGQVQFSTAYSVGNYNIFTVENYTTGTASVAINDDTFESSSFPCPEVNKVIIASRLDGGSEFADCSIAEIIIYSGILTSGSRDAVISALNTKYAIY